MKDLFPGFNKKDEKEIKLLWDNAIICFDANVLLNLYRYSDDTRKALLDLIKKFSSQICLPHQSALEYNRNRYEVIADQEKAYKTFISSIGQIENDLQSTSKPPFLSEKLHSSLKKVFNDVNSEVQTSIKKYSNYLQKDIIYDDLTNIFKNKITDEFTEEKLNEIYLLGEKRYQKKIPPGFEDEKTKNGLNKYGDLVLWKQIIEKAKSKKKPIILITDERKIDWWWKIKDGRNMGPRQELIEEMKIEANAEFHMYSSERFLSYGLNHLKEIGNRKALEEIKEIKRVEIKEIERLKRYQNIESEKRSRNIIIQERERADFLGSKIKDINAKIERYKHGLKMLDEHTSYSNKDEEESIHLRIDLKDLEERLETMHKLKASHEENENKMLRRLYRRNNKNSDENN